jgi:hypothetical protein
MLSVALNCIDRQHQLAMGKDFWEACHAGKKTILPCAYGLFGRDSVMDVWGSVLDVSVFHWDKHFNIL